MTNQLSSILATMSYWSVQGLTSGEIWQRVMLLYGARALPLQERAQLLFSEMQSAASAINLSPGGLPIPQAQLPCLDTERGLFQYRVNAPILNPDTNKWRSIVVVVESSTALGTQEIQEQARAGAMQTIQLSPEKFMVGGKRGFKVTGIPLRNYFVLTASYC